MKFKHDDCIVLIKETAISRLTYYKVISLGSAYYVLQSYNNGVRQGWPSSYSIENIDSFYELHSEHEFRNKFNQDLKDLLNE